MCICSFVLLRIKLPMPVAAYLELSFASSLVQLMLWLGFTRSCSCVIACSVQGCQAGCFIRSHVCCLWCSSTCPHGHNPSLADHRNRRVRMHRHEMRHTFFKALALLRVHMYNLGIFVTATTSRRYDKTRFADRLLATSRK